MRDRIKDYLKTVLSCTGCDTCAHLSPEGLCEFSINDCKTKYSFWRLSSTVAELMADHILNMIKAEEAGKAAAGTRSLIQPNRPAAIFYEG